MEMRPIHGQEIQGGEPDERACGHEIKVAGVGEGKVPEDDQGRPQDRNEKVGQVKVLLLLLLLLPLIVWL